MFDSVMKQSPMCPHRSMEPTADEQNNGVRIRYWSCPFKLVHKSVVYWYNQFEYEDGNTNVPYAERSRRYLLMRSYYKNKLNEYSRIVANRRMNG